MDLLRKVKPNFLLYQMGFAFAPHSSQIQRLCPPADRVFSLRVHDFKTMVNTFSNALPVQIFAPEHGFLTDENPWVLGR